VTTSARRLQRSLLSWYDQARRDLPWRAAPGAVADPYRVWISEIMLQQTTVAAVTPRFAAFVARWPDASALAAAELEDVLHAWQGLGYYARARNLHACARALVERHGGVFPEDEESLRRLPGIGAYTAGAIAAIAFGRRAAAVDGNVLRVMSRLYLVEAPLPSAQAELTRLATDLAPVDRPGDFAQALMDLGATICRPREPNCAACPWRDACAAFASGRPGDFPRRAAKAERPVRRGVVFWAERADGAVLVRRRTAAGLLGGMTEFPSTPWREQAWRTAEAVALAPITADWTELPAAVRHTFTHFHLELRVLHGRCPDARDSEAPAGGRWCAPAAFATLALPTLMKKVERLVAAERAQPDLLARAPVPAPAPESAAAEPTRRRRRAN